MVIGSNGVVVDEYGRVLLIRRDDTRTWAVPGGMVEAGELPTDGVRREIKEETGLQVHPVRLVGLHFWGGGPQSILVFTFRCLLQGGEIRPSEEAPVVEYVPSSNLPRPMMSIDREFLRNGLVHDGGAPQWRREIPDWKDGLRYGLAAWLRNRRKDGQRQRLGQPAHQPPSPWIVGAFVVLRNRQGEVLWVRRSDGDVWNLPGGQVEAGETPWDAAVREAAEETGLQIELSDLSGVYVKPAKNEMIFNFTGEVTGGELSTGPESTAFAYVAPGQEPPNSLSKQVARVADAVRPRAATIFRIQDQQA